MLLQITNGLVLCLLVLVAFLCLVFAWMLLCICCICLFFVLFLSLILLIGLFQFRLLYCSFCSYSLFLYARNGVLFLLIVLTKILLLQFFLRLLKLTFRHHLWLLFYFRWMNKFRIFQMFLFLFPYMLILGFLLHLLLMVLHVYRKLLLFLLFLLVFRINELLLQPLDVDIFQMLFLML